MKNFRTFDVAVEFYRFCSKLSLRGDAKNQLARASRSIVLNLAEGRGKSTTREQKRFFDIAMGSLRECQAVLILESLTGTEASACGDTTLADLDLRFGDQCCADRSRREPSGIRKPQSAPGQGHLGQRLCTHAR